MKNTLLLLALFCGFAIYSPSYSQLAGPKKIDYTILQEKEHNSESFTQGLIIEQNSIIETSGLYQKSFIYKYNAKNGTETKRQRFPDSIFAEGVTLFQQQLYVLSWKSRTAFILDPQNFNVLKTLSYQGEGWGITHDETHLITSNGSSIIAFRKANDFSIQKTIKVHDAQKQYTNINELEYAYGFIWANVWQSSIILAINPQTGRVEGRLDLQELVTKNHTISQVSVLNGIAFDEVNDGFWVTGKLWSKRYFIRLNGKPFNT